MGEPVYDDMAFLRVLEHEERILTTPMWFADLADELPFVGHRPFAHHKDIRDDTFADAAWRNHQAGRLSRREYHDIMGMHYAQMSGHVKQKSNLLPWTDGSGKKRQGRLDNRPYPVFALTIGDDYRRCQVLFPDWLDRMRHMGAIRGGDFASDGEAIGGRVRLYDGRSLKLTGAPDKKAEGVGSAMFPERFRLELKTDISLERYSLKAKDIDSYQSEEYAPTYILTFFTGGVFGPKKDAPDDATPLAMPQDTTRLHWCIVSPECLAAMVSHYCGEEIDVMGEKPGISIRSREELERWVVIEEWGECTQRDGLARPWEDSK